MSSSWGNNIRISIFGESHGPGVGVVIDGLPPGIPLAGKDIQQFMARRAPGNSAYSTPRKEDDLPDIQSGLLKGCTTGTPLCAFIANTNTRSVDYDGIETVARPSHADFTGYVRYRGFNDIRGGGHFSGRLTAPLVFAGAVAKAALAKWNIYVGGHIASIHDVNDRPVDPVRITRDELETVSIKPFPVLDDDQAAWMQLAIDRARMQEDSVGGVVACYALGLPAGIGSPMFHGVENVLASLLFGIPAVRGVEFGAGFAAAGMMGSEHNDPIRMVGDEVLTETNHAGGVVGGITNGMPLHVRVAFKPTPSIGRRQDTIDYRQLEDASISVEGRHDPCIVPRAVPCVEACVALALLDCVLEGGNPNGFGCAAL